MRKPNKAATKLAEDQAVRMLEATPPGEIDVIALMPADGRVRGVTNGFSIQWHHLKLIAGKVPTVCPNADPQLPEKLLTLLVAKLPKPKSGRTWHWVGRQSTVETLCMCDRAADGPADRQKRPRRADSKTDNRKKSDNWLPKNPDVYRLAELLKRPRPDGLTKIDIARELTGGNETKAETLLRQLRRFPWLLD